MSFPSITDEPTTDRHAPSDHERFTDLPQQMITVHIDGLAGPLQFMAKTRWETRDGLILVSGHARTVAIPVQHVLWMDESRCPGCIDNCGFRDEDM